MFIQFSIHLFTSKSINTADRRNQRYTLCSFLNQWFHERYTFARIALPQELVSRMVTFDNKILFVGFGFVARCTLPILLKHIKIDPSNITIIDFEPDEEALRPWIERGVTFVQDKVCPDNLGNVLQRYVGEGDLLIDLAWNIDCF